MTNPKSNEVGNQWGSEDAKASIGRRKLVNCPCCNQRFRSPSAVEQHYHDKHAMTRRPQDVRF